MSSNKTDWSAPRIIAVIVLFLLTAFLAWISLQSSISTFIIAPTPTSYDLNWTRWSGVFTGIAFMAAAVACLAGAIALCVGYPKKTTSPPRKVGPMSS